MFVGTLGKHLLLGFMTMDVRAVFLGTVGSALSLCVLAFFAETWFVAGAAMFVQTAHASIGLDELDHLQLKSPIRLDAVRTIIIHGSPRLPRTAITIRTTGPVQLRFPSMLNIRRMLGLGDADRTFTFMPGLLSGEMGAALTTALIRVVRLHGGQVVFHR
jgi:hypothetical protein